jgi:DNA gyrase subunit A
MVCITRKDANLLVVSENGYGKRSNMDDYRITKRGGKGVKTLNITDKTGKLVAIKQVGDDDDLMIINRSGITIRISVSELRVMGRATQGVRLIKLNDDDRISSVEKIQNIEKIEDIEKIVDENGETKENITPVDNEFGSTEQGSPDEPLDDNDNQDDNSENGSPDDEQNL